MQMDVGMILCDEHGGFVACHTIVIEGFYDVDEREAMRLYEALSWIKSLGHERVMVKVDAKIVADVVNSYKQNMSIFDDYISRYRLLLMQCVLFFRFPLFVEMSMNWLIVLVGCLEFSQAPSIG